MARLRALIIDDDPRACELLRHQLKRAAPGAEVLAELYTSSSAELRLRQNDYDVVFLEVQLPDGDGFDLVPFVRPEAAIIVVTGRDDQALRAFEIYAVDYILKPVVEARLAHTLRRVERAIGHRDQPVQTYKSSDRIFLRGAGAGGLIVSVEEIAAIVSSENYSEVLLACGERWFVRQTMRCWEESLPSDTFVRVHRTAIVNLHRVEHLERNGEENPALRLRGVRNSMPVGHRMWTHLKAQLEKRDST